MKTELNPNFDYRDDPRAVEEHDEMFFMCLFFSIPVIGWAVLIILIICEWLRHKVRTARLLLKIAWHWIFR